MRYEYLVWFSIAWVLALYFINVLIARRFPRIKLAPLFVYVAGVALLGVFGEILIDSLYKSAFGVPFWLYRLLPAHGGFTSYYSPIIWGTFGFYVYLFHGTLQRIKPTLKDWQLALVFAFEAVLLELVYNLSHIAVQGTYVFYYLPPDLWHLTSLIGLPFYFIGGYALILMMRRFTKAPLFFAGFSLLGLFVILFLTS